MWLLCKVIAGQQSAQVSDLKPISNLKFCCKAGPKGLIGRMQFTHVLVHRCKFSVQKNATLECSPSWTLRLQQAAAGHPDPSQEAAHNITVPRCFSSSTRGVPCGLENAKNSQRPVCRSQFWPGRPFRFEFCPLGPIKMRCCKCIHSC